MEVTLVVLEGAAGDRQLTVGLPVVLGRSRAVGLRLRDPTISRRHCEVFEVDGLAMVRDLGSLNGTRVDGRRIEQSPIRPGQRLSLGAVTFRVDYQYEGQRALGSVPDSPTTAAAAPLAAERTAGADSPQDTPPAPLGPISESTPQEESPAPHVEDELLREFLRRRL